MLSNFTADCPMQHYFSPTSGTTRPSGRQSSSSPLSTSSSRQARKHVACCSAVPSGDEQHRSPTAVCPPGVEATKKYVTKDTFIHVNTSDDSEESISARTAPEQLHTPMALYFGAEFSDVGAHTCSASAAEGLSCNLGASGATIARTSAEAAVCIQRMYRGHMVRRIGRHRVRRIAQTQMHTSELVAMMTNMQESRLANNKKLLDNMNNSKWCRGESGGTLIWGQVRRLHAINTIMQKIT